MIYFLFYFILSILIFIQTIIIFNKGSSLVSNSRIFVFIWRKNQTFSYCNSRSWLYKRIISL